MVVCFPSFIVPLKRNRDAGFKTEYKYLVQVPKAFNQHRKAEKTNIVFYECLNIANCIAYLF